MSIYEWFHLGLTLAGLAGLIFYVAKTWSIASATEKHNDIITRPAVTVALYSDKKRSWQLDHVWIYVKNHTAIHAKMKILIEYEVKRVIEGITIKISTPIPTGNYDGKDVWNIAAMDDFEGHTSLEKLKDLELKPNEEAILNIRVQVSPFDRLDFRQNPPRQYKWDVDRTIWVPNPVPKS